MFKRIALTISLILVMFASSTGGLAQEIAPAQDGHLDLPEHVPGELLIRFSPGVDSAQAASKMSQMGVTHKKELPAIGVHLVKLPRGLSVEQAINRFSRQPGVEFAEPNYIFHIAAATQEEKVDQWGWNKIQTQEAWDALYENQKNEVLLATVDTGIDSNQSDLSSRIWTFPGEIPNNGVDDDGNGNVDDTWGWDFVNNDNDPSDDNMHGTAVTSLMVANEDGAGIVGVCPWCRVLAVKVLSAQGSGTLDVVADGITYAANNGAKVINLSLAGAGGSQTLQDAVDFAWNQGAVVVAAAGNDGLKTTRYPAAYTNAISVASTNSDDRHSCFSNYNDGYISVAAPGEAIYVIDINNAETGYGYYSGTSLSTPFVSGVAGLLFGMDPDNPARDNNLVRTIIEDSAEDLGLPGVDSAFGHGRINAFRAVTEYYLQDQPPEGLFSTSDTATGYAHARKMVRVQGKPGEPDTLHLIYHTQEGSTYKIKHATSSNEGATWDLMTDDVYSSDYETYHPALATDGQFLFVAFPTRTGPTTNDPYEILFKRMDLNTGSWSAAQYLMGGTYNAVRPALYYDPTYDQNNGRLHVIASSFDDSPYLYYRNSTTQGASWNELSQFNPSNSTPNTRYAVIHASGDNIYVATKTVSSSFIFTYFYLHVTRSTDGGVTWIDQQQLSSFLAFTSGEYGLSMAGMGDRVYIGYEVGSNLYFRRNDGAGWSNYLQLEAGDANNINKWPTITQADDGQAWMIFEVNRQLYMRHYDGSNWEEKEPIGTGNYANLALGPQDGKVEWLYTNCNGSPFDVAYDSHTLNGNNSPVADDQGVTTAEDTAVGITLTASDLDGDPLTFNIVTDPVNGTLSGNAPDLTYTPDADFNGGDSFTFVASDGTSNSNIAMVSITVSSVNDPPVADSQGVSTPEDTAVSITLTASDVENDPLTYTVVSNPSYGTLSGTAPNLTYTPNTGYSGPDSFSFLANDGALDSNTATVDIDVSAVNNPPVAEDQQVITDEDAAVSITLTASDLESDPLTYSVVSGPANGTLSGTAPDLTYTPGPDFNGSDSFTFVANDGTTDSNIATISITVNPLNDPPTADDQFVSTEEDTPLSLTLTGSDVDGDPLTYSIVAGPAHGTLSGTPPDVTYTPDANFNDQDNFTFRANDGTADSNIATVSITVNAVNDPPLVDDQNVSGDEDTTVAITLTGSDVDGDELIFSLLSLPENGNLTGVLPNLTYTPDENFNGTDSFTFQATDRKDNSNMGTIVITLAAINDAPVASSQNVSTDEDTALLITLTASDVDGDDLTFSVETEPLNGTLSGTAPDLTYTPGLDFNSSDSFTFVANDGTTNSNTATVSITVDPVNDPPTADDQSVSTEEDIPLSITLTGSDVDGGTLTYSVVTGPANGTLSGTAPDLTYTPGPDFNGSDSFTFVANDGVADSNTAMVSITVNPVNDPPTADDQSVSTEEDTPLGITLTGNDVDNDPLTYSVVTGPANGTLSGTAPDLTYTPGADFNGSDSFTFVANDDAADSNIATVSITVDPVNDLPTADIQSVSTEEDTQVGITLTGSDVDSDPLTYNIVVGPAHGILSGTPPNMTYTPDANYSGADSFTFVANDGTIDSNIATVSITVDPVNDPPTADDQSVSTEEDTPLSITLTGSDVDGGTLTYSIVVGPAHGILSGTPPDVIYTPDANYSGADSFNFKANDGVADSNIATVDITVIAAPAIVDALASSEIFGAGTVSGDYLATHANDGFAEEITERDSGGKPANRYSYLEHTWTFEVTLGNVVTFNANAWSSGSSDGDSFTFAYSMDGVSYADMFTIANTSDAGYESFILPNSIQGTVYVRVTDSDRSAGNREQDTIYVDHLYISSETQPGDPPTAPANLNATAVSSVQIDLSWDSDALNEEGFKIERSPDGSSWIEIATLGADVLTHSDVGLSPDTTYYYRVLAFNASGSSDYSNIASDKTHNGLSLTANGYKDKGVHIVDLQWSGSTATSFDVYRNGQNFISVAGNSYTDNTGNKGGASYQYQVCETENPQNCSNTVQVDF